MLAVGEAREVVVEQAERGLVLAEAGARQRELDVDDREQERADGLGVIIATQNPMDLDYRALSNAGVWCVGRLSTDTARARVVDALSTGAAGAAGEAQRLSNVLKMLAPRWFLLRNTHRPAELGLFLSRTTLSWLRGPMTREDLGRLGAAQRGGASR